MGEAARFDTQFIQRAEIDASASGDTTILAAQGNGRKIRVHNLLLIAGGTVTARFYSGASATGTAITGPLSLADTSGFCPGRDEDGHFETGANLALVINLSGAVQVGGWFTYQVVAVRA